MPRSAVLLGFLTGCCAVWLNNGRSTGLISSSRERWRTATTVRPPLPESFELDAPPAADNNTLTCTLPHITTATITTVPVNWIGSVSITQHEQCTCACTQKSQSTNTLLSCTSCHRIPTSWDSLRILCLVPIKTPKSPAVIRILETWARHCTRIVFTSEEGDANLHVVSIPEIANAKELWNRVQLGWAHVADTYLNDYDWFAKLDDDTFFSPDNLRYFVRDHNASLPYYFGHTLFHISPFNAGACYVLSRGALTIVQPYFRNSRNSSIPVPLRCKDSVTWAEDVELRRCLYHAAKTVTWIQPLEQTYDRHGRGYFFNLMPSDIVRMVRRQDSTSWYWANKPEWVGNAVKCCASHPISFHGFDRNGRDPKDVSSSKDRKSDLYGIYYLEYGVVIDPLEGVVIDGEHVLL